MELEDPFGDAPGELNDISLGVTDADALGQTTVEVTVKGRDVARRFDKIHVKDVAGEAVVIGMVFVNYEDETLAIPAGVIPFGEVQTVSMDVPDDHLESTGASTDGVGFE